MKDRRRHGRRAGETTIADRDAAHLKVLRHALAHPELYLVTPPAPVPISERCCDDCQRRLPLTYFRPGETSCHACATRGHRHHQRLDHAALVTME